jgi:Tol biopolymer transport system component
MKRLVALLLVVALSLAAFTSSPARAQRSYAGILHRSERAIANQYIVVFNEDVARSAVASTARALAFSRGGGLMFTYEHAVRGFAARMTEAAALALSRDPRVAYVEEDSVVEGAAVQTSAPPGLDRIDQRDLPLDTTYSYANSGTGAHVYVIDSGIRTTHQEFGGRASVAYDGVGDGQNGQDCFGHGTHVAGIVGGATFGVAKNASLHAVRVLNCSNAGSAAQVIAGIDWVTANHASPAVALLSISGVGSTAIDTAVSSLITSGVTAVVAAGNNNLSASSRSPARVAAAITVGYVDQFDARGVLSNFGSALDLFAPGDNIESANWFSDTATVQRTGTSMAAAFTAGVAARYLSGNPQDTPAQVSVALTSNATSGRLSNVGTGSPNLLLYRPASKVAFTRDRGRLTSFYRMDTDGSDVALVADLQGFDAQWSPDGSKIAFVGQQSGATQQIYVMDADGSNLTNLSNDPSNDNYNFSWSPDGSKIVFVRGSSIEFEIYTMNADGTGQTNISNNTGWDNSPTWSSDGSKIAFETQRDGNSEIYSMNANGSGVTRLTNNSTYDNNPVWSPDGSKIAFESDSDIYSMNPNGTGRTNLTNNAAYNINAVWSPDSSKIAFTSDHLYVMNANGSSATRLTSTDDYEDNPSWSPDSAKVAFSNGDAVYVANANGTNLSNLTGTSGGNMPAWSPDGSTILFMSNRGAVGYEIYGMNQDGSSQAAVATGIAEEDGFDWSPDGRKIVFQSTRDGNYELYVADSNGANVTRLTNVAADDTYPLWSPDGSKIAFRSRRNGNVELYVMNADGTSQTRLTFNSGMDYNYSWSPDGSKIAFTRYSGGAFAVYVTNVDGSGESNLTGSTSYNNDPSFSPDGTKIAFVSDRDDADTEVYVMNADGTNVQRLLDDDLSNNGPKWSPDGSHIAFTGFGEDPSSIYVMSADGTGLLKLTTDTSYEIGPSWSPDSKRILFSTDRDSYTYGTQQIYVCDVDGTHKMRLTNSGLYDSAPSWQPL